MKVRSYVYQKMTNPSVPTQSASKRTSTPLISIKITPVTEVAISLLIFMRYMAVTQNRGGKRFSRIKQPAME